MLQDSLDDFIVQHAATQLQLHVAATQTDEEVHETPDDFMFFCFFLCFSFKTAFKPRSLTGWVQQNYPQRWGSSLGFGDALCSVDLVVEGEKIPVRHGMEPSKESVLMDVCAAPAAQGVIPFVYLSVRIWVGWGSFALGRGGFKPFGLNED